MKLPAAPDLFRLIADALPAVLAYVDREERYVFANRYYVERYGRPTDLIGRTVRDVVGPEIYAELAPHFERVRGGLTSSFESELRRDGAPPLLITSTYLPDFDTTGNVRGIVIFSQDISAEKRARDRLARMQQITAALSRARTADEVAATTCRIATETMHAQAGLLWIAQADGSLRLAGSWGSPADFVADFQTLPAGDERYPGIRVLQTGAPIWIESEEAYAREVPELYAKVKARGRVRAFAALPLLLEGRPGGVIVFSHPPPYRYDDDERTFYGAVALYCAQALERARLLDEARAAKDAAERASRVKDEFLAMLGHELRNPLAPIVTAVQMMDGSTSTEFLRERKVITRQVQHLGRLVDDLLDVPRIASGQVGLNIAALPVADVVARAVEMARPLIEERKHSLDVTLERGLFVRADAVRLAQVLANLLNNAAKYTPSGGHVAIAAAREGNEIVFHVRDDGVGIASDLLPRVFDLFVQGTQAPNRPHGGLGLGLAIVKNLVSLHGGSVEAKNLPEGGTDVTVRLPGAAEVPTAAESTRGSPIPGQARRDVLVVDDNCDAAEMLEMALSGVGYAVRVAADGESALELIAAHPPDIAVLDIGLPGIDGYELARRTRLASPETILVALSGYGQATDRERSRQAGFAVHLVKPVDLKALTRAIEDLLSGSTP
jgi:PAS domain S-box-containing protein